MTLPDADASTNQSLLTPLRLRNFRRFFGGTLLSMVGTQLTFVAFPWLVLQVTGDPLAMGLVLAVEGIPRAVFMIFGGAFTDRFSPRTVLVVTTAARAALMLVVGAVTVTAAVETWMIYLVALGFGIMDAFAWPASSAFVPRLLRAELLPPGNALVQGVSQLTVMTGPATAGFLIAWFAGVVPGAAETADTPADLPGIGMVFLINGLGFVFALIAFSSVRRDQQPSNTPFGLRQIVADVMEGFRAMWRDVPVRIIALVFTVFTLFWRGPYLVGVPVMADTRFELGALAFGYIGSAFGLGALLGTIAAGSLPRPGARWLGLLVLLDTAVLGASFLVYAVTPFLGGAVAVTALCGFLDGYVVVVLISWLQRRVPGALIGRVMSMIMFFNSGLAPVSAAVAGWFISVSLVGMYLTTGTILVALSLLGVLVPVVRTLGMRSDPVDAPG